MGTATNPLYDDVKRESARRARHLSHATLLDEWRYLSAKGRIAATEIVQAAARDALADEIARRGLRAA